MISDPSLANDWLAQLGAIGFLIIFLAYQHKQASDERREMTNKYIEAMTTIVHRNADAMERVATNLESLVNLTKEHRESSLKEHLALTDAIGKLGNRAFKD